MSLFATSFRRSHAVIVFFTLAYILLATPVSAGPIAYPGGIWGQATHDDDNVSGSGAMGWINQGVDWVELPGGVVLNTYAEYRHRTRTLNRKYYDSQGPAVGLEFRKDFISFGAAVYWERLPELPESTTNRELYTVWYYDWDINESKKLGPFPLPGSVWGRLTYDVDGLNGSGGMGFVNQGIDWVTLPGDIVANTYVEYRHRSRTKNNQYYDAGGPAVGLEFRKWFLRAGTNYYWENLPLLNESSNRFQFYISWYYSWDLNNLASK